MFHDCTTQTISSSIIRHHSSLLDLNGSSQKLVLKHYPVNGGSLATASFPSDIFSGFEGTGTVRKKRTQLQSAKHYSRSKVRRHLVSAMETALLRH